MDFSIEKFIIILKESKYLINYQNFYERRNSIIIDYYYQLTELYFQCQEIFIFLGNDTKDLKNLENIYDDKWTENDFYNNSNFRWLNKYIYNYIPSLQYHRYKKICNEAIKICINELLKYQKETIEKEKKLLEIIINNHNNKNLINKKMLLDVTLISDYYNKIIETIKKINNKLEQLYNNKNTIRYI